ncbi:c-type cytochrome [Aestuariibaculum sediminum]|uniref:C-type cytochrome n=1 Tax=Aestuariibaculum sediminum TaxID=2770637 RepID=A0A8J6Q156_9FLAO|nr:c-type cytochrome [Aestuariibaculum sediminum]MBD0830920.1 c-type cytochrome [Aestuariibaculum sediminum]
MKPIILLLAAVSMLAYSCNSHSEKKTSKAEEDLVEQEPLNPIQRGEYLVDLGGCHHCHSPKIITEQGPIPDPKRLLSGHPADETLPPYDKETAKGYALFSMGFTAFTGPWGTSFAANITPDDSGIGSWTAEQFKKSIKEGKYKGQDGGRYLLPPMPWQDFAKLTDDDLNAIFAYLKNLTPIDNVVPSAIPPAM